MAVDPFTDADFVTIAELEAARFGEPTQGADAEGDGEGENEGTIVPEAAPSFDAIDALLVDTVAALDCLPQVAIGDDAATKLRLGNSIVVRGRDAPVEAEEACATARGRLVAIGAIEQGMFKPKRVFVG